MLPKQDQWSIVKQTVALEAEGESTLGKLGIIWVILNRAKKRKQPLHEVCLAPAQFSCWNMMPYAITRLNKIDEKVFIEIDKLILGTTSTMAGFSDPTFGATHYLNIELTKKQNGGKLPAWVRKMRHTATIGLHDFYVEE